jgi:hypothetical protein
MRRSSHRAAVLVAQQDEFAVGSPSPGSITLSRYRLMVIFPPRRPRILFCGIFTERGFT